MAIEIRLPKLGLTMEEGTVDEWLLDDGAAVVVGMPILRLATDKIDVDVEAEAEGILHRAVGNGVTLEPGAVLGWLLSEGEQPPAGGATPAAAPSAASVEEVTVITTVGGGDDLQVSSADGRVFISPNARRVATELGVELSTVRGSGPGGRIVSEDVEEAALRSPAPRRPGQGRVPPCSSRRARGRHRSFVHLDLHGLCHSR